MNTNFTFFIKIDNEKIDIRQQSKADI